MCPRIKSRTHDYVLLHETSPQEAKERGFSFIQTRIHVHKQVGRLRVRTVRSPTVILLLLHVEASLPEAQILSTLRDQIL